MATRVKVILVRGLWGFIYSRGMDQIAAKLQAAGIETEVWSKGLVGYSNLPRVIESARDAAEAKKKVVLGGHSMGAITAVNAAEELSDEGIAVELLGLFDACPPSHMGTIGGNVRSVLNFYQTSGFLHGQSAIPNLLRTFKGKFNERVVQTRHIFLDNHVPSQDEFVAAVKAL